VDVAGAATFVMAGEAPGVATGAGGVEFVACWASKPVENNTAKINQQFRFI